MSKIPFHMKKVVKLTFYFPMGVEIKDLGATIGDFSLKIAKKMLSFLMDRGWRGRFRGKPSKILKTEERPGNHSYTHVHTSN